ncbi:MAG TPA: glutamate--tRNA ligase [Actinomycetota bacterium]|nr:glutamate--tRNA ligase [Actinomycetota bacterium]
MADVRVRFAPAPTGFLHVGGARTALYNWLFARHHGGAFVLRIEDTDRSRSTDESVQAIIDTLRWLGMDWDEGPEVGGPYGPYRQTERLALYREAVDRLMADGNAYRCYCTPEELEERRKAALARGDPPGYDGRCRNLSEEERRRFEDEGRPFAIRFATPGRDVTVEDAIRGPSTFPASDIRDFVMLRSDGTPTYLLAAAVDDHRMEMTHVIRGEDLHSSTPRQVLLLEALGAERIPSYAHLPLIVGPDRHPLSKRHGAVAVETFREEGFLPEALVNYLALLGWSYDDHTELFSVEDLVRRFDLDRVARNPAAFDREKLEWMNGHYLREMDPARFREVLRVRLAEGGFEASPELVSRAAPLVQERMKLLSEAPNLLRFLFEDVEPDERARKMIQGQVGYLGEVAARLDRLDEWTTSSIETEMRALQEESGLSARKAFQPVRAAVTGTLVSPPLFESMALLGRDRSLERIKRAAGTAAG